MAPQRIQDSKSDSSARERGNGSGDRSGIAKARRGFGVGMMREGSGLKDVVAANNPTEGASTNGNGNGNGTVSSAESTGINWTSIDTPVLHAYRHAYALNTPSAFTCAHNQYVLSMTDLGKHSPTMARRREKRRIGKEALALAVRRDFNAAAVVEQDVVTGFLYKVKHQDKAFRLRFTPNKPK